MSLRTTIITAGAALALIVPTVASAAVERNGLAGNHLKAVIAGHGFKAVSVKKAKHLTGTRTSGSTRVNRRTKVGGSRPRPTSSSPVVIITEPGPTAPPSVGDPNACQDNGSNCTPLGECAYWSVGCDSLSSDDSAAFQSGDLTPADTTMSSDSSSDSSAQGSSSTDTSASGDPSSQGSSAASDASSGDSSSQDASASSDPSSGTQTGTDQAGYDPSTTPDYPSTDSADEC